MQASLQQEVILPGLITGLSEVPLSMEQKMKNIEQTEAIKAKLLASQRAGLGPGSRSAFDDEVQQQEGQKLRRGMVPFEFGKSVKKAGKASEEAQQPMKVIKDPAVRRYGPRAAGESGSGAKT